MNKTLKKIISLMALVFILCAVGVTVVHHHLPDKDHDCEVCDFINAFITIVLPKLMFLWLAGVFAGRILILTLKISSESIKTYSSRAPPFIPA